MDKRQLGAFLAACAAGALVPNLALADPTLAPHVTTSASEVNDVCNGGVLASSDRARLNTNPCVIGNRSYGVEGGYQNTSTSGGLGAHLTAYPSARTRVGVSNGLELNFDAPSTAHFAGPDQRITGQNDSAIGAKYQFENPGRFAHGVAVRAILPTGGDNVTSSRPEYQESYEAGYAVNRYLTANGTVGFRQFAVPNGNLVGGKNQATNAFAPALGLTGHILPHTNLGAEVLSLSSQGPGTSGSTYGNLFVQHAFTPRVAVDVNAGQQFNATAGTKQHYVGAGAAVRF